jgi:ABC-type glycerol-3-phosphate transport system permease component
MTVSAPMNADIVVDRAPRFPRVKKGISGRSIAIIVFLTICAAFFCVPLYIIITTSLTQSEPDAYTIKNGSCSPSAHRALGYHSIRFGFSFCCE